MKFELRHHFDHPADEVWEAVNSEAYSLGYRDVAKVDRKPISEETQGDTLVRRTLVTSHKELPSFLAKAVGSRHLSYELVERYPAGTRRMDWTVIPIAGADKVEATGTFEIRPDDDGCERLVRGLIKVSIPILGGRIEQAIGGELEASYERTAAFTRTWLEENLS